MPNTAATLTGPSAGGPLRREPHPRVVPRGDRAWRAAWREIYDLLDQDYVGAADSLALADLARLRVRYLAGELEGEPWEMRQYRTYLEIFGLTPSGRKKLLRSSSVRMPAQQSKFHRFQEAPDA